MSMFRLQKGLASHVLHYDENVWLDPSKTNEIANANSQQIRTLIKDRLIIWKPVTIHSQA